MATCTDTHPNTAKLRKLMADNKLAAKDVGRVLKREPLTVHIWMCKDNRRVIPDNLLRLLELELSTSKAAK